MAFINSSKHPSELLYRCPVSYVSSFGRSILTVLDEPFEFDGRVYDTLVFVRTKSGRWSCNTQDMILKSIQKGTACDAYRNLIEKKDEVIARGIR